EKWPRERLAERRAEIGAASFARGYRLVCLPEEEVPIRPEWVRFWTGDLPLPSGERDGVRGAYERVVLAVEPGVSVQARSDRSALVVLGRTAAHEVHCLEATARRVPTPELVHLLDDADRRWRPEVILFESNAAFAGIRDLLVRHAGFGPRIKSVV